MAGNAYEWTMEVESSINRVYRGGAFYNNGIEFPSSARVSRSSNNLASGSSFRISLYII